MVEHHGQRRAAAPPASARTARQAGGPEDESTAIIAEAEQAATEAELKALGARARKLPDGPLRVSAAEALKAAGRRLGLTGKSQPAPEPGSGG